MKFKYKTTKEFLTKPRTKKQYANMLRVLYGKKKDRGHHKAAFFHLMKQEKEMYNTIRKAVAEQYPQLSSMMNFIGGYFY